MFEKCHKPGARTPGVFEDSIALCGARELTASSPHSPVYNPPTVELFLIFLSHVRGTLGGTFLVLEKVEGPCRFTGPSLSA